MIKLIIDDVDGYNYILKDKNNKTYHYNIEFYDLAKKPSKNDSLFVNEKFLQNENVLLSFGSLDGIYGKKIDNTEDSDLIILSIDNKRVYLKRFYG